MKRALCVQAAVLLILTAACAKKNAGSDFAAEGKKSPPRAQVGFAEKRNSPIPINRSDLAMPISQETEKPLVTLRLNSSRPENVFDSEAPVILHLEVFSPKVESILSQGLEIKKQDLLEKLMIGSVADPWWNSLRLIRIEDEKRFELHFDLLNSISRSRLDLAQREVGYLQIILDPAGSLQIGPHKFLAILETGFGKLTSNVLEVVLKPDILSDIAKYRNRLSLLLARGKNEEALSLTDEMIGSFPDRSSPFALKADVLERLERFEEAREMLIVALERFPSVPPGEHGEGPRLLMFRLTKLEERMGLLKEVEREKNP